MKELELLKNTVAQHEKLHDAVWQLQKREKAKRDELKNLRAHLGVEDESGLHKIRNLKSELELIPDRIAAMQKAIDGHELYSIYRRACERWDRFVLDKKEAEFDAFLAAIRPWFRLEEERITRRSMEPLHIPAVAMMNRYFAHQYHKAEPTAADYLEFAKLTLAHIGRVLEKTGWKLPE